MDEPKSPEESRIATQLRAADKDAVEALVSSIEDLADKRETKAIL